MIRTFTGLALLTLAPLAVACSNPADNKTKAKLADAPAAPASPAAATEPASASVPAGAIRFDQSHGSVAFLGSKVSGSESGGTFAGFSGHFVVDGDAVKAARVTIDMTTVTTAKPKLTKHLRDDDFFDVVNHPTAQFVTKSITAASGGVAGAHTVKADLTLRGVTKSIEFPATITKSAAGYALQAEFAFDRQPFGVAYKGSEDNFIRDEVVMTLQLTVPAPG